MIELKGHTRIALRSMEAEYAQLQARMNELNAAFRATLAEQIPAGASLDNYELKRGTNGEMLGLVEKPKPAAEPEIPANEQLPLEAPAAQNGHEPVAA